MRSPVVAVFLGLALLQALSTAAGAEQNNHAQLFAEVAREFITMLSTSVAEEANFTSQLTQTGGNNADVVRRRLMSTRAAAGLDMVGKSWELVMRVADTLDTVIEAKRLKLGNFFDDILGADWKSFAPLSWFKDISWEKLGLFDVSSNIDELLTTEHITELKQITTLGGMYSKLTQKADTFCEHEEYIPFEKMPMACFGPVVNITFVPKSCELNMAEKKLVCDPAKLILVKFPGYCTHKYRTASSWTGKTCMYNLQIGTVQQKIVGGGAYQIDLGQIDFKMNVDPNSFMKEFLIDRIRPDAPVNVAATAVDSQPLQRKVTWEAAKSATLQGILKYTVKCVTDDANPAYTRTVVVLDHKREAIMGADVTGENRPLQAGQNYTCAVAAVNIKASSKFTAATSFTTTA